jgi:FtsP/CotA-like multicopper oxidase with cupredoxin domain
MRVLFLPRSFAVLVLVLSVFFTCGMAAVATRSARATDAPAAAEPAPVAPDAVPQVGPEATAPSPPALLVLEGTLSEYFIYLPQQAGPAGTVRFVVQNIGQRRHNLRVVGNGVDRATPDLRPGQTGEVEVFFADPGPYTVYCDLADHADRGMTTGFVAEDLFTQP